MAVKYLAGDRLIGTAAERAALSGNTPTAIPQTSWKELGRTILTSSGSTCTVTGLASKDNLLILRHTIGGDTAIGSYMRVGNGSIDSGSNYAERSSYSGGSDATAVSQAELKFQHSFGVYTTGFDVTYVRNMATEEKLFTHHYVYQRADGAGNAPERGEAVGKWTNTSNVIDQVQMLNASGDTGAFQTDTELIVLGCDDDEADSGTNFWQELGSNTLTAEGDVLTTTITAKKYLMVDIHPTSNSGNTSNNPDYNLTFNGATSGYAGRSSQNGGSDGTFSSGAFINGWLGYQDRFVKAYVINVASKEKLAIGHDIAVGNSGFGAGTAPQKNEWVGKWANTSDSITTVTSTNSSARPSAYGVGASIRVWGSN